jgi:hypothetical protein
MATLNLIFSNEYAYERAIEHFDGDSNYYPSDRDDSFRCLIFDVDDEDDADTLEGMIESELNKCAFIYGYRYEYEDE